MRTSTTANLTNPFSLRRSAVQSLPAAIPQKCRDLAMSKDNDSPGDRKRVADTIWPLIMEFYRAKEKKPVFFCDELRRFIARQVTVAPASPDRILRMMRQAGALDYKVTDRSNSEYTFYYQKEE